jgi:type II secretory pathway component PulK
MNRRGAALLLVLWLLVLLSGLVAVGLGGARTGAAAARNRLALLRAAWAREACLEIVVGRARGLPDDSLSPERLSLDSVDLGQGIWCELGLDDPGERLDVNQASGESLRLLTGDSLLAERLLAGRPWPAVEALSPDLSRWAAGLTVRSPGRVNLNRAAREVLRALPGVGNDGAAAIVARRPTGPPIRTSDEAIAALPRASRARVLAQYDRFVASVAFRPGILVATSTGHAGPAPLRARVIATLVPAGDRLAIIRRETE